ncbi:glycoside hydrolase family 2 protein [Geodermatophilus sp. SYSU D00814]
MPVPATAQDGSHPRPQLVRDAWTDLCGPWQFTYDDDRRGETERWYRPTDAGDRTVFDREITVPYPPESPASGIGDPAPHPVSWYRRSLRLADVAGADAVRERGHRVVLRFAAVDYAARVWLDGTLLGEHEGGQTPFSFDVTALLAAGGADADADAEHVLVVRAEDDPRDVTQPRGKQDWLDAPHDVWYHRTSGIWQPVWLEVVPPLAAEHLAWTPDLPGARVHLDLTLTDTPLAPVTVAVRLVLGDAVLAQHTVQVTDRRSSMTITTPHLVNGEARQHLTWSPETPRLVDAQVRLLDDAGAVLDEVASYLGLRSSGVGAGAFLLNARPYDLRAVLAQNYWPESHLAAPDAGALRREVELIKELGFNAVRVHQKVEDPRFLYWCDRLGVLVWGETANAYAFTPEAVRRLTTEWLDVVHRDVSHPCIVTWVPMNESWGVHDVATDPAQQAYTIALAALTRAVDPSRPVVSNDGFEHTDSDLLTVHDYSVSGALLAERLGSPEGLARLLAGFNQQGRRVLAAGDVDPGRPVVLSEFGGARYTPGGGAGSAEDSWGYCTASTADEFAALLTDWYDTVRASPVLAGSCYTQLTDTLQEGNGLLDRHRRPKIPIDRLRAIITGRPAAP